MEGWPFSGIWARRDPLPVPMRYHEAPVLGPWRGKLRVLITPTIVRNNVMKYELIQGETPGIVYWHVLTPGGSQEEARIRGVLWSRRTVHSPDSLCSGRTSPLYILEHTSGAG